MSSPDPASLDYCYLTTTGRLSGRRHRVEMWFALHDGVVYLLSGGGMEADWVRNLIRTPEVTLELADDVRSVQARVVDEGSDEDPLARRLLVEKYQPGSAEDLGSWGVSSLPIAVDWD